MKKSFISQYNFFPEIKTDIFKIVKIVTEI